MEVTILNNIIHGHLKPWMIDTSDPKPFIERVQAANSVTPTSYQELQKQVAGLLRDFPLTLRKAANEKIPAPKPGLQKLFFKIELPTPYDPFTQFYLALIVNETLRLANCLIQQRSKLTNEIDIRFLLRQT